MGFFKKEVKDDLIETADKVKKPIPKWLIGVGIGVVAVVVIFGIKIATGGSEGVDYYNTLSGIFSNELGTFKYVFDVRTGEAGTIIKEVSGSSDATDLQNLENADESAVSEETSDTDGNKFEFSDWNEFDEVQTTDWEYPNYQVTIEGCTTSLDPLTTTFTISLATKHYNDVFTDVTCIKGNYYINIESMREWLINSKDTYLVSLGNELPQGSKYLVVPEEEFKYNSRYAESGEVDLSTATGLKTLYQRFLVVLVSAKDSIKGSMGDTGINTTDNLATLNLSGSDAVQAVKAFRGIVNKTASFHTSYLATAQGKGLYTDEQLTQASRETDNIVDAFYDMYLYLNTADLNAMNTQISGTARQFQNGKGNTQLEGNMVVSFCANNTDYMIQFTGTRIGNAEDVLLPQGSQLTVNDLAYPTQIGDISREVIDYFNVSSVKLSNQLELNPTNMAQNLEDDFIKMVNEIGCADKYLTRNNIEEYIETYATMEETSETTAEDKANMKLVMDYLSIINDLTGGVVVEKEVVIEEEVEMYPEVTFEVDGATIIAKYNEELSDSQLMILDLTVVNKSLEENCIFDVTKLQVKDLLGSVLPANNEVLLKNYDNEFDVESLVTSVELLPSSFSQLKVYIVLGDSDGHMDIFYEDTQYGAIIEY